MLSAGCRAARGWNQTLISSYSDAYGERRSNDGTDRDDPAPIARSCAGCSPRESAAGAVYCGRVVALALDFSLGIAIHFWVQDLVFPADMFARHRDQFLLSEYSYATWNNFLSKCALGLAFVGDLGVPAQPLVALLAVRLGLTLRHALRPTSVS